MSPSDIPRRQLLAGIGAGLALSGCERIGSTAPAQSLFDATDGFSRGAMRLVTNRSALAREYEEADMSPRFRANGSREPQGAEWQAHRATGFRDWRLTIGGLVARPLSLSLDQLRQMPRRVQITRHDCVEGWSAIGKWHGVPLRLILDLAGANERTRYVLFRCADEIGGVPYYETIDMVEALHPQTILAYGMNDALLPVPHGAPLRLRSERQLGYKHAKFVMGIEAIDSFANIAGGKGGYWEDRSDYDWWAGI
ncbi:molybdopterin-binding protein [Pacificimonas flava]|uniref:Molybdopterin-binding protein n=2 Tax=Pacificimonas TaxID=1960290 RepID=A0A219B4B4_9SPHN|nr:MULTISPECIES: molybdopterin-dependent oxidoreductase [Pacificimonas]MBZ6377319.1 molybdopterin-dependent oxidoreductase [Pacificimonas aurantium]OWV32973.1 molybdopterin-binding protein [Pacificimonas flava]